LARTLKVPHIEFDAIFHQPGWTPLDDDTFRARVGQATEEPGWVVDGNDSAVWDTVWQPADTVVWIDLPYAVVMVRTVRRTVLRVAPARSCGTGTRSRGPSCSRGTREIDHRLVGHAVPGLPSALRGRPARGWGGLDFVHLGSQREADTFLAGLTVTAPNKE